MIRVQPSRAGYEADAAAVAAELALVPDAYGQALGALGIRVVACRDSVVDHLPHLAQVGVRGWPPGSSWTSIPGVYSPQDRAVVVATVGEDGARRVPRSGERHGSMSLAVHETFHGFDYSAGHRRSKAKAFRRAWKADAPLLGNAYYTNKKAGHEESYAESAARAFGLDERFRSAWPSLAGFWSAGLQADPLDGLAADAAEPPEGPEEASVIGFGRFRDDGALVLDLRAEGPGGLVGHGLLVVDREEPRYGTVSEHLGINPDLAMDAIDTEASFPVPRFR